MSTEQLVAPSEAVEPGSVVEPSVDKTKATGELWNRARKAEAREREAQLLETFGTADLSEIKGLVDAAKSKAEATPDVKTNLDKLSSENEALKQQIANLNKNLDEKAQEVSSSLITSTLSTSFSKLSPVKPKTVIRDFLDDYKVSIDQGVVNVTDLKGNPVFNNENQIADLDYVISKWSELPENSRMFAPSSVNNHINDKSSVSTDHDPNLLSDPHYVAALNQTGEYRKFMDNKPYDKALVTAAYGGK